MTHMDVQDTTVRSNVTRSRWGLIGLAVIVAGAAICIRTIAPTNEANAQVARRRTQTQPQPTATPRKQLPPAAPGSGVAAVVNGEPISRESLGNQCLVRWGDETLESLVNKQLITTACTERGIVISEHDIDAEINDIAKKFGMSTEQYLTMLQNERDVSEVHYRRDIVWPTIALKRLAADRLTVTEEQLAKEFESQYGPKVQVRMISLTSASEAAKVLQLARANPDDFPTLAKEYSADPNSASAKGLIPPVRKHMGEPAIEKAVFALKVGEISEVVEAANQFFVFKCERLLPAATISPQFRQQARAAMKDQIIERNLRSASGNIFKALQSKAKIVNVWNNPKMRQQSPGVAAFVNDRPVTMKQLVDECIARYGRDMVETEISFRLLNQALKQSKRQVTQAAIQAEVERAAESYGYLKKDGTSTPDVDAWVKAVTEQDGIGYKEYIRDAVWPSVALKELVGNRVTVDQEDLEKGFAANYGERVEVLAIVLGNQRVAQQVWDMARKNKSKEFFGQLAEQYSIEPVSRANFGEIPPIRRYGGQPQIEKEAFRLKAGELSGIVAMDNKFVVLKCLGRTTPNVEQLSEVKEELVKDIREKKLRLAMAEEYERLRAAAQIDNFISGTSQTGSAQGPAKPQASIRKVSTGGTSAKASQSGGRRKVLLQPPRK